MSARGVVLAVSVAAVLAALAGTVDSAYGCSRALGDPRTALRESDAAFVGTLLERREGPIRSSADDVTLVFRVERAVKGQLGRRIQVHTAAGGGTCGVEARLGQRIGLFPRVRARVGRPASASRSSRRRCSPPPHRSHARSAGGRRSS